MDRDTAVTLQLYIYRDKMYLLNRISFQFPYSESMLYVLNVQDGLILYFLGMISLYQLVLTFAVNCYQPFETYLWKTKKMGNPTNGPATKKWSLQHKTKCSHRQSRKLSTALIIQSVCGKLIVHKQTWPPAPTEALADG